MPHLRWWKKRKRRRRRRRVKPEMHRGETLGSGIWSPRTVDRLYYCMIVKKKKSPAFLFFLFLLSVVGNNSRCRNAAPRLVNLIRIIIGTQASKA